MKQYKNIDEYIKNYPEEVQVILQKIRKTIQEVAPTATEAISYGIPTFKLNGNLVHFAGYAHHIGFYPGAEAIEVFAKDISEYNTSKGTIQFPLDKPVPYELIAEITEFRIKKNSKK